MADAKLIFHVPPEAGPEQLLPLLEAMCTDIPEITNVGELLEFAKGHGLKPRTEVQSVARSLDLLTHASGNLIKPSPSATTIISLKPEVRPELVHFLFYTTWKRENSCENTISWSYRQVCSALWERAPVTLTALSNVIAEEIRNTIQEIFHCDPSFGPKSIRGVKKWVEAVNPPAIAGNRFVQRQFCSPELALLATSWVTKAEGDIGVDFLLTPQRREAICRVCLLDPSALDRVLDWMLPLYPEIVRSGTNAGVYGRFVRFLKWPQIVDLLHKAQ